MAVLAFLLVVNMVFIILSYNNLSNKIDELKNKDN